MEPSSMELKIISCKDLKAFNFFQKLTIYALVSIASDDPKRELDDKQKQQQRTQTHRDGDDGSNPEWNQEMRFDLGWVSFRDCDHLFFHFVFRHNGLILGDKLIGEVRVPLKDLIREASYTVGVARFVNYEVRNSEGKHNGVFNFSYKVNSKAVATHSSQILEGKITAYPSLTPDFPYQHAPNQSHIQYPTSEIETPSAGISYPTMIPVNPIPDGHHNPSAPPPASAPLSAEYHCYYPPPPPHFLPPPPPLPYSFPPPPPPPPPVAHGPHYYQPFGPGAHGWSSDPNFQHIRRR